MFLKGARGSDLTGLLNFSRGNTLASEIQSICSTDLGASWSSITSAICQTCKNDLLTEIVQTLGYDTDEGLLMADAAVLGYALTLSLGYSETNAKQVASGAAIGAYAGYIARDTCCGLDREAIEVAAVFACLAAFQSSPGSIMGNLQTAWNNIASLALGS